MGFWDEWTEGKKPLAWSAFLTLAAFLALLWVVTNIPPEADRALIYLLLCFAAIVIGAIDYIKEANRRFGALDFGASMQSFGVALAVGAVSIYVLIGAASGFSIAAPTLATTILSQNGWLFFYIVAIAPLVEEKFFRGSIFPTLQIYLRDMDGSLARYAPYLSVIMTSVVFALFHFLAYGASGEAMRVAFIFSLIAIIGNQVFKSLGFGLGMHVVNNWLAFQAMT